jgi:thermolysin
MRRFTFITLFFVAALFAIYSAQFNASAKLGLFQAGNTQELELAKNISYEFIAQDLAKYGINNVSDLRASKVEVDTLSMAHTRFQQTFEGVPVFGGEAIVHLNQDGSVSSMTDNLVRNVNVNSVPSLSLEDAVSRATKLFGCGDCLTEQPQVEMVVIRRNDKDHLAYRVELTRIDGSAETSKPVYFIDAHTGKKIFGYNNLQTVAATGSGPSLYSGTVSFTTSLFNSTYYMEDIGRKIGTFDFRNGTTSVFRFTDTNNVWDTTAQRPAIDAQIGATRTFDYFKNTHGRTGINGSGGPAFYGAAENASVGLISSRIHYSTRFNNAFWDGQNMTYGDGDGTTFTALVTTDICSHELTHGITQFTANLIYQGESGALNESMSDVFGAMVERFAKGLSTKTWKIGEECFTPANGTNDALRYMDNPHLAGNSGFTADDDPDHYTERYTGTADSGGVHINSGIPNKVFHLVAAGGTNHRSTIVVTSQGTSAAERIWYRALTVYMTSSTNFAGARAATLQAATDLFGSTSAQRTAVANAWSACGVN